MKEKLYQLIQPQSNKLLEMFDRIFDNPEYDGEEHFAPELLENYLEENGYFRDIDVALMMHGGPDTCVDEKSLALSNYTVVFLGKGAHAALAPEQGRMCAFTKEDNSF